MGIKTIVSPPKVLEKAHASDPVRVTEAAASSHSQGSIFAFPLVYNSNEDNTDYLWKIWPRALPQFQFM